MAVHTYHEQNVVGCCRQSLFTSFYWFCVKPNAKHTLVFATVGILILQQGEIRHRTIVCYTFMMMEIYFNPFFPAMQSENRQQPSSTDNATTALFTCTPYFSYFCHAKQLRYSLMTAHREGVSERHKERWNVLQ